MGNRVQPHSDSLKVLSTAAYFARVREQLSETGQAYVRVTGVSMRPLLHHLRDGVIIVPPEHVSVGDIVLYARESGRYALHRVIGKKGAVFTMAGDNQWHIEEDLPCSQIVGVVSALHRNGRVIPSKHFSVKIYAAVVTLLARPRIFLRRVISFLLRPFRRAKDASCSKE